jgi:hypothetical protein
VGFGFFMARKKERGKKGALILSETDDETPFHIIYYFELLMNTSSAFG